MVEDEDEKNSNLRDGQEIIMVSINVTWPSVRSWVSSFGCFVSLQIAMQCSAV